VKKQKWSSNNFRVRISNKFSGGAGVLEVEEEEAVGDDELVPGVHFMNQFRSKVKDRFYDF
jgi:hypothetical protein